MSHDGIDDVGVDAADSVDVYLVRFEDPPENVDAHEFALGREQLDVLKVEFPQLKLKYFLEYVEQQLGLSGLLLSWLTAQQLLNKELLFVVGQLVVVAHLNNIYDVARMQVEV